MQPEHDQSGGQSVGGGPLCGGHVEEGPNLGCDLKMVNPDPPLVQPCNPAASTVIMSEQGCKSMHRPAWHYTAAAANLAAAELTCCCGVAVEKRVV